MSGCKIDLSAIAADPATLIRFIALLMGIRAVPVAISLALGKTRNTYTVHERASIALYCTTALPIIVAVTSLAVKNGTMDAQTASIMVAAGAVTVFLMPLLAQIVYGITDRHPVDAVKEIANAPKSTIDIIKEHAYSSHTYEETDYRTIYLPKKRYDVYTRSDDASEGSN